MVNTAYSQMFRKVRTLFQEPGQSQPGAQGIDSIPEYREGRQSQGNSKGQAG